MRDEYWGLVQDGRFLEASRVAERAEASEASGDDADGDWLWENYDETDENDQCY